MANFFNNDRGRYKYNYSKKNLRVDNMNKKTSNYQRIILFGILSIIFIFSIPGASADSWEDHRDTSWTSGAISTPEQLAQFAYLVNTDSFTDTNTVYLTKDIDLDGHEWVPIGAVTYPEELHAYGGKFEGKFFTISNMTIETTETDIPTEINSFGKNVSKNYYFAGLFGYSQADIENITVTGNISHIMPDNYEIYYNGIGGIVGYSEGNLTNCTSYVNITCDTNLFRSWIGGIAGISEGDITCCFNYGEISTDKLLSFYTAVGGITGHNDPGSGFGNIKYCVNSGNITHSGTTNSAEFAGICGLNYGYIDQCANTGNLTGNNFKHGAISGIAGESLMNFSDSGNSKYNYPVVSNCYNRGEIETSIGNNVTVGGIVGNFSGGLIKNCYNTGNLKGDMIGGLIGTVTRPDLPKEMMNCYFIDSSTYGLSNYHNQNVSNKPESDMGTKNTSDEMKDPDYVNLLNENEIIIFSAVEDDYPVFV